MQEHVGSNTMSSGSMEVGQLDQNANRNGKERLKRKSKFLVGLLTDDDTMPVI